MRFPFIVAVTSFAFLAATQAAPVVHIIAKREIEDSPGYPTQPWKRTNSHGDDPAPPWRRDATPTELRRAPKSTETDAPPWKRGLPTEDYKRSSNDGPGYPTNDWRRRAELSGDRNSGTPTKDWRRGRDFAQV